MERLWRPWRYAYVTGERPTDCVFCTALAADRVYEFFFVLAAPRLEGAVQVPVHPIAIR